MLLITAARLWNTEPMAIGVTLVAWVAVAPPAGAMAFRSFGIAARRSVTPGGTAGVVSTQRAGGGGIATAKDLPIGCRLKSWYDAEYPG